MRKLTLLISLVTAMAAGAGTAAAAVTGNDYTLTPKSYDAGTIPLGTSASFAIVAQNRGHQNIAFRMRGVTPQSAAQAFSEDIHDYPPQDDCYWRNPDNGDHEFNVLAPGEQCVLRYRFAPRGKPGPRTASAHVEVGSFEYPGPQTDASFTRPLAKLNVAISLKGKASALPFHVFPAQFGSHTVGATDVEQATILNYSAIPVAFVPTVASPKNAPYTVEPSFAADECATPQEGRVDALVVPPGDTCTVTIRFHPTTTGTKNATVRVDEFAVGDLADPGLRVDVHGLPPATSGTFSVTAKALPVSILVNTFEGHRFPVDFGRVRVGYYALGSAEVDNLGDAPLDVAGGGPSSKSTPFAEFPFPDSEPPNSCWTDFGTVKIANILPPYGSCLMPYRFKPTIRGAKTATGKVKAWPAQSPGGTEPVPTTNAPVNKTVQLKGTAYDMYG